MRLQRLDRGDGRLCRQGAAAPCGAADRVLDERQCRAAISRSRICAALQPLPAHETDHAPEDPAQPRSDDPRGHRRSGDRRAGSPHGRAHAGDGLANVPSGYASTKEAPTGATSTVVCRRSWMAGTCVDGPLTASVCQSWVVDNTNRREPSMKEVTTIGLDLAKAVFQVHGVDAAGAVTLRRA